MDPEPLVLATAAVPIRFVVGVVAAVVATFVMDRVMARLPEGETPPFVASGVLTDRHPDAAPGRLASVVHYLAGGLTGPLFVWLAFATEWLLGAGPAAPAATPTVTPSLLTTLVAAVVLYVLMVGFFAVVVLPQSKVDPGRVGRIRLDWAVSAAAYLLVLVPLVHVASVLL